MSISVILRWLRDTTNSYANLITAIATAVIAVFTWRLWIVSNRQWLTAQDQLRISERPYLEIAQRPVAQWTTDKQGNKTGITIYFENAGDTPAQRLYVNAGNDPKQFTHLTIRPVPLRVVPGQWFKVAAGESIMMDIVNGARRWIPGVLVPSHATVPVQISGLGQDAIEKGLKAGKGTLQLFGDFEYVDIFGEYCCEPFTLQWNGTQFVQQPSFVARNEFCAPDIQNVCRIPGEPMLPSALLHPRN